VLHEDRHLFIFGGHSKSKTLNDLYSLDFETVHISGPFFNFFLSVPTTKIAGLGQQCNIALVVFPFTLLILLGVPFSSPCKVANY
jgi:hypothetical protein